jgi:hypothetical protein
VVFDGPRRLSWHSSGAGDYVPTGLWPDPAQAARVLDHLYAGGSLLVLVEQPDIRVPMFTEEAERLPPEVAERATLTSDGVLSELRLPALDWMPPALRERGLRFLEDSAKALSGEPDLLLPQLLVESPPCRPDNLRFGRLRTPRPFYDGRLEPVADHLFAAPAMAVPVCPAQAAAAPARVSEATP